MNNNKKDKSLSSSTVTTKKNKNHIYISTQWRGNLLYSGERISSAEKDRGNFQLRQVCQQTKRAEVTKPQRKFSLIEQRSRHFYQSTRYILSLSSICKDTTRITGNYIHTYSYQTVGSNTIC